MLYYRSHFCIYKKWRIVLGLKHDLYIDMKKVSYRIARKSGICTSAPSYFCKNELKTLKTENFIEFERHHNILIVKNIGA